ncbi:MAG: hypothetical protein MMC33_009822 [Icmadophila ericetorum]|nr:hypothetical protein [Icmadophila ericetorum]
MVINDLAGTVNLSLTVTRIIPAGSDIFRFAYLDDVNGLKYLFSRGLASPNDIDFLGQSALYNALYNPKIESIKFLLRAGLDPYFKGVTFNQSAHERVWRTVFSNSKDSATLENLRSLFPISEDFIQEQKFSTSPDHP